MFIIIIKTKTQLSQWLGSYHHTCRLYVILPYKDKPFPKYKSVTSTVHFLSTFPQALPNSTTEKLTTHSVDLTQRQIKTDKNRNTTVLLTLSMMTLINNITHNTISILITGMTTISGKTQVWNLQHLDTE
jgi:hypothetical protein